MTTATKPTTDRSLKRDPVISIRMQIAARTRTIIEAEYALNDSVQLPVVAERVRDALQHDPEFMKRLSEMLYYVAYDVARDVARDGRQMVIIGDTAVTRERARASKRYKWNTWLEHVGDKHLKLQDMDSAALLIAETERTKRGKAELQKADFLRQLRLLLEPGQTVGNRFDETDLDRIYTETVRGEGEDA